MHGCISVYAENCLVYPKLYSWSTNFYKQRQHPLKDFFFLI